MTGVPVYPLEDAVDVPLRDGSTVRIRPVRGDDREAIGRLLRSMSRDSLYFRGLGYPNIDRLTDWSVDVDYADRYGLVVTAGADQAIVAHAAYVRTGEHRAEVAFEVGDSLHGHGIGTLLLGQLASVAARHGITEFTASVMSTNHKMLEVFQESGFPVKEQIDAGISEIRMPTLLSEEALDAFKRRAQTAAIAAVTSFLRPRAVAIVGASRRPLSVGSALVRNLVEGGFGGFVYPVNRRGGEIQGLPAFRSVGELPEPVDLAVVATPANGVVEVARDCAGAGVRALVVITSDFAESGAEGAARQQDLLAVCRQSGMRLVGPNCFGVLNNDPDVRLNATFATHAPAPGAVAMLSQSGGVAIALIEAADRLGLGISSFVSVGNRADISGNDLLEYWESDANTRVIVLYLESFGNPRRFARIARRVGASKPILAVKSGRTPAGARAASSHSAALVSASDVTVDALFRQAGVIRAETLGELLDTAALLGSQPLPRGDRVAIVTNGGGPGIMCADACQASGLNVVELEKELRRRLERALSSAASLQNPIDLTATATARDFSRAIETLAHADACDVIITLFVPPLMTDPVEVAAEIDAAAVAAGIPVASVFMTRELPPSSTGPRFALPEEAVRAIAHAVDYAAWRSRPAGATLEPAGCRSDEARLITATALARGAGWLGPSEVASLFACYGLPLIATEVVGTPDEAVAAAVRVGSPVAIKAVAAGLVHKTDVGGVRLDVQGEADVRKAANEIRDAVATAGHELEGLIVQPMAATGVELLLGVVHDPSFGPVLVCGAGGVTAELLGDIAVRITPLTDLDAHEMVRSLRTFPLLDGYRGAPKCDVPAIEDVLLRLSALVENHPEIAELDANPLLARPDGVVIVDARVRIQQPAPPRPLGALRT